jgi:hypothetical protein
MVDDSLKWGTQPMARDAEIEQIKRELALLRSRYAQYGRLARILKAFCIAAMLLLAIGAVAGAIRLFLFDTLYAVFFVGALLVFVPGIAWLVGSLDLRWIDLASPQLRGIYSADFFYPDAEARRSYRSFADLTEQQIADRERALSELGAAAANGDDRA